jgi:two-component system cell cycle sensor histidine kinase/response regulator CckA
LTGPDSANMKTLIVEDNADDRRILRYNLEQHGCSVLDAADGREGLELAKLHKPDLIISDALMPKMDGYQLLRNVKTNDDLKSVPFIFYSAVYTDHKEAELALSIGADAFIVKPKEPDELWEEILGILENCTLRLKPAAPPILAPKDEEYLGKYSVMVAAKLDEKVKELGQILKEREQIESSLKQQLGFLQTLIDTIPDPIFYKDVEGRYMGCNSAFEALLGRPRADIIGKTVYDVAPREAADRYREADLALFKKPGTQRYERSVPDASGALLKFLFSKATFRDLTGNVAGLVGVMHDLSNRERFEESIQEQKQFAESLLENSAVAAFVLDPQHKVVLWNKACRELTGVSAPNIVGTGDQWKPFYDHQRPVLADLVIDATPDRLPGLYSEYAKSTLAPNALHAEGWYRNLNGKDRYLLFDAAPIHDGKGELLAAIETLQDITEHKRAEEQQRDSEMKLRTITNTAADAIVMIDDNDRVTYWNPAAKRMMGYSADEVMGKDIAVIIPHRYQERHKQAFAKFIETGRVSKIRKSYEVEALRKDGSELPVELSVSGVRINGKCYSVGIIRDISERKKLEEQLLQSQKMEAVGQLAGGVAHDFNNILSAIIGYGHLLRMKMNKEDPLRVNVEHMLESADRAAHLTHGLLAFSRKLALNPRPVDLHDIIRRVDKLLRRVMREDIELKTSFKQRPMTVNADPGQLEQVLMNLATNARDAMPRGGTFTIETDTIELDDAFIRTHGYGSPGMFCLVSVTDTGTGINDEMQKRIFEPFFTTKEVGHGTGLGLSMVYGTIKQHHGYINVYSEPGKGTIFRIYLPLIETEIGPRDAPPAEVEERLPGGTETVLVAEDDDAVRKLSRAILQEFGYTVIEATDGVDAVNKFTQNQDTVQLVVMDMIMPKKSGKDAYESIKKIKPGIKMLFVSGYTADRLQHEKLLAEGMELIPKPISPVHFLKKVREVLDR